MSAEIRHGTRWAYCGHGCRCALCTEAMRVYKAAQVERNRSNPLPAWATHGTVNTYNNYGCRCEPCRAAKAAYIKQRRAS